MSDIDTIGVKFEGDSTSLQDAARITAEAIEGMGEASSPNGTGGENLRFAPFSNTNGQAQTLVR